MFDVCELFLLGGQAYAAISGENQALFRCMIRGFACNVDVNAARNIAAGHAVTARGGVGMPGL
jgi:putative transposase